MGVDLTGITGYVSDKNAKQFIDAENAKFSKEYKTKLLDQKSSDSNKKYSLEERKYLLKMGLNEAQINYLEANTKKSEATTKNIETKTDLLPEEFKLTKKKLDADISYNNQRIAVAKTKAAKGDSSAKLELQQLSIQQKKLLIKQAEYVNAIYEKSAGGGASADPLGILGN